MQLKSNTNTIRLLTDLNLSIEYGTGQLGLLHPDGEEVAGKMLHQFFPTVDPQLLEEIRKDCLQNPGSCREMQLQVGLNGHARQFKWLVCSRKSIGEEKDGFVWVGTEIGAEGALKSKAFEDTLRQMVSEAVCYLDTDFCITSLSDKAAKLFQVHAVKAIGSPLNTIVVPGPADVLTEACASVLQQGSWQGSFSFISESSDEVWVAGKLNSVKDTLGNLQGYLFLLQDITAQKHAAAEQSRQNASLLILSAIIEQSGALCWATDKTGRKQYLNKKLKEYAGLAEDITTVHLNEIFDPATAMQYHEENEWVINEGKLFCKVEVSPNDEENPVWFRTLKFPVHTNLGVMAAGIAFDVTNEYAQERELAYLKQRFEIAASITANIITDWDIENDVLWRNDPTSEIPVHAHKSKSMQERFGRLHPEDKQHFIYSLNQALLSTASKWECEYRYELGTGEGQYKLLNEKGVILRNSEGEAVRMVSVVRDVTEKRRLHAEIRNKEKQVIAATIEGQENERNELARELHDNVGQVLAMCKLFVDITADAVQHEYLGKCREHLEKAIREIRSLSHRLSPVVLDRKGLPGALAELVDNINQTGKLSIQLTIANNLSDTSLNKTLNMAAYRIVQEAISNILRHAEASKAFIRLELAGSKLECRVTDNGKGFDPKNIKPGIGLRNIRNRAEYIGGTLHLHSAPGKGCTLEVVLPLKELGKA